MGGGQCEEKCIPILVHVCKALIKSVDLLNEYDGVCGDGDCGRVMFSVTIYLSVYFLHPSARLLTFAWLIVATAGVYIIPMRRLYLLHRPPHISCSKWKPVYFSRPWIGLRSVFRFIVGVCCTVLYIYTSCCLHDMPIQCIIANVSSSDEMQCNGNLLSFLLFSAVHSLLVHTNVCIRWQRQ